MPNYRNQTIESFISALASADPVPGGGSVAPLVAALGVALTSMCAALTVGKPKYAQHEQNALDALAQAGTLADELLDGMRRDSEAFLTYMTALRMPKTDAEDIAVRRAAIQTAARGATDLPLALLCACEKGMTVCESLLGRSNTGVYSDLAAAGVLLAAAARLSLLNIYINLSALGDDALASEYKARGESLCGDIARRGTTLCDTVTAYILGEG